MVWRTTAITLSTCFLLGKSDEMYPRPLADIELFRNNIYPLDSRP